MMKEKIFEQCQRILPKWADLTIGDFDFDEPKGFSSFTMGIRAKKQVEPSAVLYRKLEGKENSILEFDTEKDVFLMLGEHNIAAECYYYDETFRIEKFYEGRTLRAEELFEPKNLHGIAVQLYRFHQLMPTSLPDIGFFELLHKKWRNIAKHVLVDKVDVFPPNEQKMCEELREICSQETIEKVKRLLPEGELTFCHNDTYHGNIMKLDSGEIKLVDFEFSCLNHKTYDFSNLFAETVMRHKQPEYPYFKIVEPEFGDTEIGTLINFYLDNAEFETPGAREKEFQKLLHETKMMLIMSDYKYAMAALPLAIEPIQNTRFIPYAHQRFARFIKAYEQLFGDD